MLRLFSVGDQSVPKRRTNGEYRRALPPLFLVRLTKLKAYRDLCLLSAVLGRLSTQRALETGWALINYH